MGRIRTIKPELPQSESMGNISRDARLTFVLMWTLADDEGRLRGNSRMLASLLFPYDDDAPDLIDRWLDELDQEGCIVRYKIEGQSYIEICKWLIHQKIDRPSKSKIPKFDESSRVFANSIESSSLDQGSKDQGSKEGNTTPDGVVVGNVVALPKLRPDCPHQEIIAIYHEVLPMCPRVRDWTPARATQLRARWNEDERRQNLGYWRQFFEYVAQCEFLTGRAHGNGRRPFFADLEWIVKSSNFTKIREGKYANLE